MNALMQLDARKAKLIVICDEGDTVVKEHAHTTLEMPKTAECLQGKKINL